MGDPATITYTEPVTGRQREIKVPGSGAITPKNSTEEQVLRSFERTDVLKGNSIRAVGERRASPKRSSKRSTARKPQSLDVRHVPAKPAETEG